MRSVIVHGAADMGKATVETVHDHDFHATISYWMVLDHERRTYRHAGCDYRLTDVQGSLVQSVLA